MAGQDFSGISSTADGADAELNVNVSEDSARNLWDVQAAIQQISVDFESAVRSAADFQSYLISIRETSQTVKMPDMGGGGGGGVGGNMSYDGGRVDAPAGLVNAESSQVERVQQMEANSSGVSGGVLSSRGPLNTAALGQAVNQAVFMAGFTGQGGGRGQGPGGGQGGYDPYDPNNLASAGGRVAGGGSTFNPGQLAAGASALGQAATGRGFGQAAGMLGRVGAYGAIGYAAFQAVDTGLQTYAQSRATAISSNNSLNGTGWGLGTRIDQSIMSMSPFVTGEEASQIYNSAVAQGWASNSERQAHFGTAVDFMYGAARDYNMDPGMSSQLLQTNAMGAGQSINALAQQLFTLKETLDGTGVSTDVANASFSSMTSTLIGLGSNPEAAAIIAGGSLKGYAGNSYLGASGRGAEIIRETISTQQTQNVLGGLTGTIPGAAFSGQHGLASSAQLEKLTARFAKQVMGMSGADMDEKAAMFAQLYNGTFGTQISQQDSLNMIAENVADPNLLTKGQREYLEKGRIGALQERSGGENLWNKIAPGERYHEDAFNKVLFKKGEPGTKEDYAYRQSVNDFSLIDNYSHYNPEVEKLLMNNKDQLDKVVLYGPDGKPILEDGKQVAGANIAKWFNEQANYNKFAGRKSGYFIQDAEGAKHTSDNIGLGGLDSKALVDESDKESRTVYISLSGLAKKWFETDKDELDTGYNR